MTTRLDKELKRQVTVDGSDWTLAVGPDGLRLTGKGKRKPQVQLQWLDLLSGDAALAAALNASLSVNRPAASGRPATPPAERGAKPPSTKRRR